jgi:uncharacterized protein
MQGFADMAELHDVLTSLIQKELVAELVRRPGQKEERYAHRLSEDLDGSELSPEMAAAVAPVAVVPPPPRRDERMDRLEAEVAALREDLAALRAELGV